MFRAGAFQGRSPQQAYFVVCDASNNAQATIDAGQVHIRVGFSPVKPAEFIIIELQQLRQDA
ncbi:MAG: phage tail sheath protein FI [Myxococcota bacterium]|jgi:phage tail sheath protein FI